MMLSIGEVAQRAGIEPSAIRYYEEMGLLPRAKRAGGRRQYEADVLDRLALIALAKESGFTVKEIRKLVADVDPGTPTGERWRTLATRKLQELDDLAGRIERMRRVLRVALDCGCMSLADCAPLLRAG